MSHHPPYPQGGHHGQPPPQQTPQQTPPPVGHIAVTTSHPQFVQIGYKSVNTPQVFLDGYQVSRGWGRRVFPSWPGRHHLLVQVRSWGSNFYRAELELDVYPGRLVELVYMTPRFNGPAKLNVVMRR